MKAQYLICHKITKFFSDYIANSRKSINFVEQKGEKAPNCEIKWSDARVAEEARLESVYTPKAYREFESRSLRKIKC